MAATKTIQKSKGIGLQYAFVPSPHTNVNDLCVMSAWGIAQTDDKIYQQGHQDGQKDKEIELYKMGKALFQMARNNADAITSELIAAAKKEEITIYDFYLHIEDWDKIHMLIVVKLEDFIDDKIYNLYDKATKLSLDYNCDSFHWDYRFTYYSDKLKKETIISDGFSLHYEHIPVARSTQQESV